MYEDIIKIAASFLALSGAAIIFIGGLAAIVAIRAVIGYSLNKELRDLGPGG